MTLLSKNYLDTAKRLKTGSNRVPASSRALQNIHLEFVRGNGTVSFWRLTVWDFHLVAYKKVDVESISSFWKCNLLKNFGLRWRMKVLCACKGLKSSYVFRQVFASFHHPAKYVQLDCTWWKHWKWWIFAAFSLSRFSFLCSLMLSSARTEGEVLCSIPSFSPMNECCEGIGKDDSVASLEVDSITITSIEELSFRKNQVNDFNKSKLQ